MYVYPTIAMYEQRMELLRVLALGSGGPNSRHVSINTDILISKENTRNVIVENTKMLSGR